MKIAFHTLGCKVNQNDTQALINLFREQGDEIVPFEAGADVYVINTCAVTKVSEQKSRQTIRKGIDLNPRAVVVVTGCYAQTSPQKIAGLPGVNLVVGIADRPQLAALVAEFTKNHRNQVNVSEVSNLKKWFDLPVGDLVDRTRAMLKVEEGCDEFCSYCIVPYARGRVRSMPIAQATQEYTTLVEKGFREVILTGIHLGQYGKDLGIQINDLLLALLKINSNCRIRLGSLEPRDLTPEFLDTVIGNLRICQYLHIPLQSGSDRILKRMNRNYNLAYFADLINRVRKKNPLIAIGTDLIVGFPGETQQDFEATCNFIGEQNFSRTHVFRYSPREGTPAAEFPEKVAKVVQEERSRVIQEVAVAATCQYAHKFINQLVEVLFEERTATGWSGLSGEYLRVFAESTTNLKNIIRTVRIQELKNNQLIGSIIF